MKANITFYLITVVSFWISHIAFGLLDFFEIGLIVRFPILLLCYAAGLFLAKAAYIKLDKTDKARKLELEPKTKAVAAKPKAGHVYIVSNIQSFGDDVYKIGMTKQKNPYDRIDELNGANILHDYLTHVMIPCENAPEFEKILHHALDEYRIESDKEFFKVSLERIQEVVNQYIDIEFTYPEIITTI